MPIFSYPKSKIKVVLLEDIHPKAVEIFKEEGFTHLEHLPGALSHQELLDKIHEAHVVGIRSATQLTKAVLDHCPKLLTIGCFCIGTNQVDLQEALLKGIPVFNDPHSNTRSVAELIIGLCIILMRDIFSKSQAAHAGQWKKMSKGAHEVRGKILGIVGYGRIGTQVSVLAESLGMQVYYYDIERKLSLGNAKPLATLDELLSLSDIVTLHVPETPLTLNMINAKKLRLMKKSAYLINTSRGKVVDIGALADALTKNEIRGAAIDVFQEEPKNKTMPFVNPLQKLDNVILTPHIGGATEEAQENIALSMSRKLIDFINRGSTEGAANFPSLSLPPNEDAHRILHIHQNQPGMLMHINKVLADRGINILGQYLRTTPEVGYVVLDIEKEYKDHLAEHLKTIKGTIRVRILY